MKRLRCWLVKPSVLIALFWGTTAVAQTDLLNLDSYQEGDMPAYGENIVVKQDEKTAIKWISQVADAIDSGTIRFPVSLSGDFELFIELDGSSFEELFLTSDEYKIQLSWLSGNLRILYAGEDRNNLGQSGAQKDGINKIRFSVVNNVAKVYMNDVFDGKLTLKPDLVYSQLMMQNIGKNTEIYALQINGASASVSPTTDTTGSCPAPTTTPTVSGDCMATYSLNGRVHIPCISVPDAFGGTTVYNVQMQQQSGAFTFDLDLTSVTPR